jgi:hypothetical protein
LTFVRSMLNLTSSLTESHNQTCVETNMPSDIILFGSTSYSLIFLIGVVGNFCVILVLAKEKEMRNFTNYLLANLSIADLLVLFVCVPIGIHDLYAKERWYLGKTMCYLIGFFENCMGLASILSILFITIDRYLVICRPIRVRSLINSKRTCRIIIFIWSTSILLNLPFIFLSQYKEKTYFDCSTGYTCILKTDYLLSYYYILTIYFLFYFVVAIVLLVMYYKIFGILDRSNKFLLSFNGNPSFRYNKRNNQLRSSNRLFDDPNKIEKIVPKTSVSISPERKKSSKTSIDSELACSGCNLKFIKQRKKVIAMLVYIVVLFYVCWLPLKIWNFALVFISHKQFFSEHVSLRLFWYINITVRIFFYLNSAINPIVYNWFSKRFRQTFKSLLPQQKLTCD